MASGGVAGGKSLTSAVPDGSGLTVNFGWRTIETAPRDVAVLVFDAVEKEICVGQLSDNGNWVPVPMSWESELLQPFHWMPLPEPPQ